MVLLNHITYGQAMFGVRSGALVDDAVKIGINAADQRRMMNEGLNMIARLPHGETITEKIGWYKLDDARLQLPCFTQPHRTRDRCPRSPISALATGRHGVGTLSIAEHRGARSPRRQMARARRAGMIAQQTADRRNWRLVTIIAENARTSEGEYPVPVGNIRAVFFRDVAAFPVIPPRIGSALLVYRL
jgi:limonene 1,2-monooxygenase